MFTGARIVERAQQLQAEMLLWQSGKRNVTSAFTGTFRSLFELYEVDSESTYHSLKDGVRRSYGVYIKRLRDHIGDLRIDVVDGRDVKRWFAEWRAGENNKDHLARARMVLSVLKAAVSFGVVCRKAGCREFQAVLGELEFDTVPSRTFAPTAEQIIAARQAAHDAGAPERALLYALVYETTGREFDFLGQWLPVSDRKTSGIVVRGRKWIGPMWSAIDEKGILTIRPTKTEDTSNVIVTYDLSVCPMVMEEIAATPEAQRAGPLIANPSTKLPYVYETFRQGWRDDFKNAKLQDGSSAIPRGMWCRDIRAGGVTEGGKSGASKDDRRKVAGHAHEKMTERYDRDSLEAHRRIMAARTGFRSGNVS